MPYVRRDTDGQIASLHRQAGQDAAEFLPDDHPEVRRFVGLGSTAADTAFEQLDADFIRVLEDLIDALIRAHVIKLTDLPIDAQRKLQSRKYQRSPSMLAELNLLGDADPLAQALGAFGAPSAATERRD